MNPYSLAIFAYASWGFVPLYWKLLQKFLAQELILYRVLFSALFLFLVLILRKEKLEFSRVKHIAPALFLSGLLIGFNWLLYIWAVNNNHVVEASLGYFLNPLLNILLGQVFFKETLHQKQKTSILFAVLGVSVLIVHTGTLPWVAFLLGSSFALYGLVRKKISSPTLYGTFIETTFLALPAFIAFLYFMQAGKIYLFHASSTELIILSFCGVITTLPLLAFADSAKKIPLSTLGFFQFISPSLQFLLGIYIYHEPFDHVQWLAFLFIWIGLAFFIYDLIRPSFFSLR